MKTAMQELIEFIELNIDDNDFIKHQVLEEADKAIEKEKEQIIQAYESSINTILLLPSGIKSAKGNAENYYNQTYNN